MRAAGRADASPSPWDLLARERLLAILEARAEEAAGDGARDRRRDGRVVVGMVGYPNVGKSSTVNALVAKKKTGVSSTPGKTKHFQTLELGDGLLLADCPGLVFPSFTSSRAELVCNGVLPIDRLTDVRQPVAIVASRIPRRVFEATYKLKLPLPRCTRTRADARRRGSSSERTARREDSPCSTDDRTNSARARHPQRFHQRETPLLRRAGGVRGRHGRRRRRHRRG